MKKTRMDDFKTALYSVRGTFSQEDAKSWTTIACINNYVERLLDDKCMMKNNNQFTFSERTLVTRHNLLRALCDVMAEDAGKDNGYFEQAKKMFKTLSSCSVQIRTEQI